MNDDLISRKTAIQAIADIALGKCVADEETDDNETCKEKSAMFKAHQDLLMAIRHVPSIPAVTLDKLCEWLGEFGCPCSMNDCMCIQHDIHHCIGISKSNAFCWRYVLTKGMEGLGK